ncbi:MAG: 2TM domain-containing protein [Pseudomonadota bacterium]
MSDETTATPVTMSEADEEQRAAEKRARKRVDEIKGFYHHLTVYLVVNAILFLIDIFSGGGVWFYWVLLGWGIAIAIHASNTFSFLPWTSKEWEERKVRELMAKDSDEHRY